MNKIGEIENQLLKDNKDKKLKLIDLEQRQIQERLELQRGYRIKEIKLRRQKEELQLTYLE